ncbi:hypothetical protein MHYP_G00158400 [Metynnis hypsauchen]
MSSSSLLGGQLRSVVLCATGLSAAAITSYFVFYRWRRILDQQRRVEFATQTEAFSGTEDREWDIFPSVPIPENLEELPFVPPSSCGPLARIWQYCREVDRANKSFASTYTKWTSDDRKLVEVKLQHKAVYSGLESEHWWVLTNDFYHVRSQQLPPLYFARAIAVAYIKNIGRGISEAKIYLRTETTESSVQDDLLQTTMCRTFKEVSVDQDGRFRDIRVYNMEKRHEEGQKKRLMVSNQLQLTIPVALNIEYHQLFAVIKDIILISVLLISVIISDCYFGLTRGPVSAKAVYLLCVTHMDFY